MSRFRQVSWVGHGLSAATVAGIVFAWPWFANTDYQAWAAGTIPVAILAIAALAGIRLWVPIPVTFTVIVAFVWFALVFIAGLEMARDPFVALGVVTTVGLQALLWFTGRSPDSEPDQGTFDSGAEVT